MDPITKEIASLIQETGIEGRPDLAEAARRAFADYLAALYAGLKEEKVRRLAVFLASRPGAAGLPGLTASSSPENAALFAGFASHYLDYDDAQSSVMGHFSTVLFSVLLAAAKPSDRVSDFLAAYLAGSETEGLLGRLLNPAHKRAGFHPTATIGHLGAAAALARFRRLSIVKTAELLSLGATEAAGLEIAAGTDMKPLHPGFAARDALMAYFLLTEAGLFAPDRALDPRKGWPHAAAGVSIRPGYFKSRWLAPGEILSPGLWMKEHHFCSAAITGAAGLKAIYEKGFSLDKLQSVTFHFPPKADVSLQYEQPRTGQEGRFSIEYVAWQILTIGHVDDSLFKLEAVPEAFREALSKFRRVHDLPEPAPFVRRIKITAVTTEGEGVSADISDPPGSPARPFTAEEQRRKLAAAASPEKAARLLEILSRWPAGTLAEVLEAL